MSIIPSTIKVTQDHIDTAIPRDSSHCMIVDGIKESIPRAKRISVDLATIRYTLGDTRYVYLTPRPAQIKLLEFDKGDPLTPFAFKLGKAAQTVKIKQRQKSGVQKTTDSGKIPKRTGGKTPPIGPLANQPAALTGQVRRYGLKAMLP